VFAKLLLFLLVFFFIFVIGIGTLARAVRRALFGSPSSANRDNPPGRSSRGRFGNEEKAEHMLPCSVCGVHVPESDGIKSGGKFFCCEAHRK
jgi:uncharacterized protein